MRGKLVCIAAYMEADRKVNISINLCANMLKVSGVPDFNLAQRLCSLRLWWSTWKMLVCCLLVSSLATNVFNCLLTFQLVQ